MESVVLGGRAVAFAGAVGADLIFGAVRTTSTSVMNGVNYIYSSDKTGIGSIKGLLDRLDIRAKVTIINTFIDELSELPNLPGSVTTALIAVENALHCMKKEIETINTLIDEHSEKWFSSYRTLDYSTHTNLIKHYNEILDIRVNLLMKLLNVKYKR